MAIEVEYDYDDMHAAYSAQGDTDIHELRPPMYGCECVHSDGKECDMILSTLTDINRCEDGYVCPYTTKSMMAEPYSFELG